MIKHTKDFDIFKFREDNRLKIDRAHVRRLVESISSRNLLEMRPIMVNLNHEVIDGQHRLLAAKELGAEIYYEVREELDSKDIILVNLAKSWGCPDYLNYFCVNGFPEYQKLKEFLKLEKLSLKIALGLTMGAAKDSYRKFKSGEYKFEQDVFEGSLQNCWETIELIKKFNGFSSYTSTSRFWKALIVLVRKPDFNQKKWLDNLGKMVERFSPRAKTEDYLKLLLEVYNWRNKQKLKLGD